MRMGKCMRKVFWKHGWQHDRQDRDLTKQRSGPQYLIKEGREKSVSETRLEKVPGWLGRVMGMNSMWASRPLKYSMGLIPQNPGKSQEKGTELQHSPCRRNICPHRLFPGLVLGYLTVKLTLTTCTPALGEGKRLKSPLVCSCFSELDDTWTLPHHNPKWNGNAFVKLADKSIFVITGSRKCMTL